MNMRIAQERGEVTGPAEAELRSLAPAPDMVRDYAAGEVIFGDGKPPCCMYVVLTGEVEVLSDERIVGTIHEGQALGNLSLLDVSPRLTAARAAGPCRLALLDEKRFRALIEREPNFIVFMMQELGSRANA